MTLFSKGSRNISNLLFFIVIAQLFWFEVYSFFWIDELYYLESYFSENHLKFIFSPHWEHFLPVFRFTYLSEIFLFGKNAMLFQFTSVAVMGIAGYLFFKVYANISNRNGLIAALVAVLMMTHPAWTDTTLWSFQICILLQVLFQALAIIYYFKSKESGSRWDYSMFWIALIVQNYCFGNGIFFPVLFMVAEVIEHGFKRYKDILLLVLMQIVFLLAQMKFASHLDSVIGHMSSPLDILANYIDFLYVSLTRLFFIKFRSGALSYLSILLAVSVIWLAYRNDKKKTLFGITYLFLASFSIPIARPHLGTSFHYYYTTILFPPLFYLIYIMMADVKERFYKPVLLFLALIICGYFFVDLKAKRIYAYTGFKNKERLNDAVKYHKKGYYPFNDYYITSGNSFYLDNMNNPIVIRSIQKDSIFEADSSIWVFYQSPDTITKTLKSFKEKSAKAIDTYKKLSKKTRFDLDVTYEEK